MNYLNAGNQQSNVQSISAPDVPLLPQELDRMQAAILDLDVQLDWLITKIQPVCQPSSPTPPTEAASTGQIMATPSGIRQSLIDMRRRIEGLNSRISAVKYTIEV